MMRDVALLARLKIRHLRGELTWWGYMAGTDLSRDARKSAVECVYQLYVAIVVAGAAVLGWLALLARASEMAALIGASAAPVPIGAVLLAPSALAPILLAAGLRQPALRLTAPDATFLANGSLRTSAMALVDTVGGVFLAGVVAGLAGYLVGSRILAAWGMTGEGALAPEDATVVFAQIPWRCALYLGIGTACAQALTRICCITRMRVRRGWPRALACGLALALLSAVALLGPSLASGIQVVDSSLGFFWLAMIGGGFGWRLLALGGIVTAALLFVGVPLAGSHLRLTEIIEGSTGYSELQDMRHMASFAPDALHQFRRARRIAGRSPRLALPAWRGRGALVGRALVGLARWPEGLVSLAWLGAVVIPFGVVTLTTAPQPSLLLIWMCLLAASARRAGELARTFRDDTRLRLVRDRLPYGPLTLLGCEALPAVTLTAAVALSVTTALIVTPVGAGLSGMLAASGLAVDGRLASSGPAALAESAGLPTALALALLMVVVLVLSGGLGAPSSRAGRSRVGVVIFGITACLLALTHSPLAILGGVTTLCAIYALIIRRSEA